MKINWGFGPPKESGGDEKPAPKSDDAAASEQHSWTAGASLSTRVIVGLLWAALIAGPLALAMQVLIPSPQPVVRQDGYVDRIGEAAAVGEFAQRAVVAWLETPRDRAAELQPFFGDTPQNRPQVPWTTDHPAVAEIVKDDTGLWSVVVGVDATEGRVEDPAAQPEADAANAQPAADTSTEAPAEEESAESGASGEEDAEPVERITSGRLYFQVPVLYVEGQMIAQALPAPVPAPAEFDRLRPAYRHALPSDHPAHARVTNFLNAMLVTGDQAELEAYSNPGTSFRALDPVPYAALQVTNIVATGEDTPADEPADGERVEVQADVTLSGSNGEELGAQYFIVLLARQGRWEVAELRTAPALAEPVPVPTPTHTPTPTPTPTTPTPGASGSDSPPSGSSSQGPSTQPTREAGSDPAPSGSATESP